MTRFVYRAKTGPSKIVEGLIEAENAEQAVSKIVQLGYSPLQVEPEQPHRAVFKHTVSSSLHFFRRVRLADRALFFRQISDLVGAQVPLLRALQLILKQTKNPAFKEVLQRMVSSLEDGKAFSEALSFYPHVFAEIWVNVIKAGELSGRLPTVLDQLTEFIEKQQEVQTRVTASLIYPVFVFFLGCLAMVVLLTFVIPKITVMYEDVSEQLPLATSILMGVSEVFVRLGWLLWAGLIGGAIFLKRFHNSAHGRWRMDSLKLRLPIWGEFVKNVEIGRLMRTLGVLLESGVEIVSALESGQGVLENAVLRQEIKRCSHQVMEGSSLTEALKTSSFFPETAIQMIAVGEESGRIEKGLYKLATTYERQAELAVKTFTSLFEAVIILVLGGMVGFVVVAGLLPILKMNFIIQ